MTGSARCTTLHGSDFQAQVMYLLFDGFSIQRIAKELGCNDSIITRLINGWQATLEGSQLPGWKPRARNPRRVKGGQTSQTAPSLKII